MWQPAYQSAFLSIFIVYLAYIYRERQREIQVYIFYKSSLTSGHKFLFSRISCPSAYQQITPDIRNPCDLDQGNYAAGSRTVVSGHYPTISHPLPSPLQATRPARWQNYTRGLLGTASHACRVLLAQN